MSYPTTPVFIHRGTWDDETRQHPAMKFMENYTVNVIDGRKWDTPTSQHHVKDFTYQKSTGETFSGADEAWSKIQETYGPFNAHQHDPTFIICWETEKGWDMFGIATLWWNLAVPGNGQKTKGRDGREWDGAHPAAFRFEYVREGENSVRLARTEIYGDPTGAVVLMLKRGMLKPEQMMG